MNVGGLFDSQAKKLSKASEGLQKDLAEKQDSLHELKKYKKSVSGNNLSVKPVDVQSIYSAAKEDQNSKFNKESVKAQRHFEQLEAINNLSDAEMFFDAHDGDGFKMSITTRVVSEISGTLENTLDGINKEMHAIFPDSTSAFKISRELRNALSKNDELAQFIKCDYNGELTIDKKVFADKLRSSDNKDQFITKLQNNFNKLTKDVTQALANTGSVELDKQIASEEKEIAKVEKRLEDLDNQSQALAMLQMKFEMMMQQLEQYKDNFFSSN